MGQLDGLADETAARDAALAEPDVRTDHAVDHQRPGANATGAIKRDASIRAEDSTRSPCAAWFSVCRMNRFVGSMLWGSSASHQPQGISSAGTAVP